MSRRPEDGTLRKLLNAVALLVTPLPNVSTFNSVMVGTLKPIGQTELPSILDQFAERIAPLVSTDAQSLCP